MRRFATSLALAALVAGALPSSSASALTGVPAALAVDPGTSLVTVNQGAAGQFNATAGTWSDTSGGYSRSADATLALRVAETTEDLKLVLKRYSAPSGVETFIDPAVAPLFYAQSPANRVHAPVTGWSSLIAATESESADDSSDAGNRALTDTKLPIFVTARQPGAYVVQFVDAGSTGGTDDDRISPEITITVLDTRSITGSALSDDWRPAVAVSPSPVGVGKALTARVDLTQLTGTDARGSSSGVGVLRSALARLVGVTWTSAVTGDALAAELAFAGAFPGLVNYTSFASGAGAVDAAGARVLPRTTEGIPTLRSVGTVVATAYLDRDGDGPDAGDQLLYTGSTADRRSQARAEVVAATPDIVTLSTSTASLAGAGTVRVSGTAADATQVTVRGEWDGVQHPLGTVDVAADGRWAADVRLARTAALTGRTSGGVSSVPVTVTVTTSLTGLRVTRAGRVATVSGKCNPAGCRVSLRINGTYIKTGTASPTTGAFKFTRRAAARSTFVVKAKAVGTSTATGTVRG